MVLLDKALGRSFHRLLRLNYSWKEIRSMIESTNMVVALSVLLLRRMKEIHKN